ncbi:NnrS family protein [Amaricoccus macauensis]|uniref:NnrS family protein n=1 Tax=Amaricoccus macauensis TaxID=57001 RepID=UPI003C7C9E6C
MPSKAPYTGPALISYGFRPFFFLATLFALLAIPVWLLVWRGTFTLGGPFSPIDWHIHEMLFGYAAAVIAGFLFTAVPNWTGRLPVRGWPLGLLAILWLSGRIAVAGGFGLPAEGVMVLDCAFLLVVTLAIGMEIMAGRNWRNLRVLVPVSLLWAANVIFHQEAMRSSAADLGVRLGFAVVVFLLTLIGGRIIPSFTRNWLTRRDASRLPAPFGRVDRIALIAGASALLIWVAAPVSVFAKLLLALAAVLHSLRLARWKGEATWPSPLLLMLHVSYAFAPAGLLALAMADTPAMGLHLLGIGAIGGMTVAVMIRATRGHTGRSLVAGRDLTFAYSLIVLAALIRTFLPNVVIAGLDGILLSGLMWTAGFALIVVRIVPWLALPPDGRKTPGQPKRPQGPGAGASFPDPKSG